MADRKNNIRVRYAPSPTGHLHVGSLRTALFNWLFARHHEGVYLVRIEDTDHERSSPKYTDSILDSLRWSNLESDEPLIYQSQRTEQYQAIAHELLKRGAVYRCYCTQEEVRARVHAVTDDGTEYFVYDGRCRDRTDQPDQPFVLRMRVPRDRDEVVVEDLIHGTLRFPLSAIDDFVIVRSDGSAMYNFTVVVDDAEMRISHVIRGDDHIINTPRQVLIYEAAGYTLPQFAHIPLILGRDGKKLSKRDAATAAIDYKDLGYLSDALCNYLVRLGWAHGDREVIHRDELVQLFSLDQVGAKAALFDPAKLLWMNSVYIKEAAPEMLVHYMTHDIDAGFRTACSVWSDERLYAALRLYRDRCKTLVELRDAILSLVHRPAPEAVTTALTDTQKKALRTLITRISECTEDNIAGLKELITSTAQEYQLPFSDLAHPLRKALTGTTAAPGVADLISVVGVEEAIKRITTLLNVL